MQLGIAWLVIPSQEVVMSIRIGSIAPDFEADSTQGRIRFHQWIGSSWCVLFSHPKDFTPVCTTELGYMARLKPEFERRNCKIAGLSVDRVEDHARWLDDIKAVTGTAPNYPLIGDPELRIADQRDRKSTRLNSSHSQISYAVFCLKKKKHYSKDSHAQPR